MESEPLDSKERDELPITYRPLLIWAPFLVFAILGKLMHWPGGTLLLLFTSGGVTAYVLSKVLVVTKGSNLVFLITLVFAISWLGIIVWGMQYNNGYPFNLRGFTLYLGVFVCYFVLYLLLDVRRVQKYNSKNPEL